MQARLNKGKQTRSPARGPPDARRGAAAAVCTGRWRSGPAQTQAEGEEAVSGQDPELDGAHVRKGSSAPWRPPMAGSLPSSMTLKRPLCARDSLSSW